MEVEDILREQKEIDNLLEKGVYFTVPITSFLRFFTKKKERRFVLKELYLGTMDVLADYFIKMQVDEKEIERNPLGESKKVSVEGARLASKVVAVAYLNNKMGIRLFGKLLSLYFLWHIKPSKLFQLALLINKMGNYADFINSIRLLTVDRTTKPKLVEEV